MLRRPPGSNRTSTLLPYTTLFRSDATNVGMISSAAIDAIGPDGLLVNVARGQLVDEDALIDALRRGRLGAAALDVFATEPTPPSRWEGVPNIICTPHIAGASRNNLSKMTAMLRSNRSEEHTSELQSLMR